MIKAVLRRILPPQVKSVLRKIVKFWTITKYISFRIFPIKKNKIVVTNFLGKGYGDNAKYIVEELLKSNIDYDIVWLVNDEFNKDFPLRIRRVRYNSFRAIYEEVTAKVWIDNSRKSSLVRKRKEQFYIQTWHGGIGPKCIEKDAEKSLSKEYIRDAKNDSKMADLMISNSAFKTRDYKEAFWYSGEILECGSPRNDIFFGDTDHIRKKVKEALNIREDVMIVLYTPTFRQSCDMSAYSIDYDKCFSALEDKFARNWVALERLHPNIIKQAADRRYSDKVINASLYDDIQELMVAADILITDYSSTMFDFMLTNRPVFLYATDINDYLNDRNFRFDLRDLPFPLAETNAELINNILYFNEIEYNDGLKKLYIEFGIHEDGRAAKRIVERIAKVIKEEY